MAETKNRGYTIRIFLPDGAPDGLRVVEKSNWTGRGVVCPRSLFRDWKARPELSRTGVYVLVGPGETGMPLIYVGEGDPALPRLEQHFAKKDFWTSFTLFTSKDENLNKAHVQYLEARLIRLAEEANRCELDNGNRPELPSLSEIDKAEVDGFLDEMLLCFPILGLTVFEKPKGGPSDRAVLQLRLRGIEARGYEAPEGFVVLKGSLAAPDEVPSIHPYLSTLRQTLKKKGILAQKGDRLELQQDYAFNSPSTAGGTLLGRTCNGRTSWKNAAGKTLKELQEASAGS